MMIAGEREFLKAYERWEQLVEDVGRAGKQGRRIDEVERMLFVELLAMELDLLRAFVAAAGDGDVGKTCEVPALSQSELTQRTLSRHRIQQEQDRLYPYKNLLAL